jgi:hypothetical protein
VTPDENLRQVISLRAGGQVLTKTHVQVFDLP